MGMLGMAVPPSQASSDNTGCVWGKYCPLSGVPFLDVYNDTRVNMMLLVGEPKNFILPRLTMQRILPVVGITILVSFIMMK